MDERERIESKSGAQSTHRFEILPILLAHGMESIAGLKQDRVGD